MMKPRTTVRRRYRVVKELPWIEGGRPAPGFQWEGGRAVIYKPGDTAVVEDREVICGSLYRKLEALDEVGCSLLEVARAKADAPARITAVADLHPRTVAPWTSNPDAEFAPPSSRPQHPAPSILTLYMRSE